MDRLFTTRRTRVLGTILIGGSLGMLASAQRANFTGAVRPLESKDVSAVRFEYDAGARSYWHTHEGVQLLVLERGRGRVQIQGQPLREMVPGQPVLLPGGVAHWHGAAPNEGLTQLAMNVGGVKWGSEVADKEYLAAIQK
jgi:quercetin dioxygenase-like cupin family protein